VIKFFHPKLVFLCLPFSLFVSLVYWGWKYYSLIYCEKKILLDGGWFRWTAKRTGRMPLSGWWECIQSVVHVRCRDNCPRWSFSILNCGPWPVACGAVRSTDLCAAFLRILSIYEPVHPPYNPFFSSFFQLEQYFSLTLNQSTVFFSWLISPAERGLCRFGYPKNNLD
jgi:hypothetical protein